MTDINERYAAREKLPNITKLLKEVGDKVVGQIMTEAQELPVHNFVRSQRGEQLFWQNKQIVKQSALDLSLPHDPITQWVFDIQTKDGTRYTAWMDKNKKKALIEAIKSGQPLLKGGMIAIELTALEDSGTDFPRKLYKVQLKPPKSDA